jgi:hypothetical protein
MSRLKAFDFTSDTATYADSTTATAAYPASVLTFTGFSCPLASLPQLRTAARALLDQGVDGTTTLVEHVDGTTLDVTLSVDRATIQLGSSAFMPRAKAEDFLGGLVEHGLLPPLTP